MPRDAGGTYTLPLAPFVPNTLARASDMNTNLSDIAAALTASVGKTGGEVQGDLVVDGNVSAGPGHNVSAGNAVIADHILAFRTGTGYGGAVGSWDTTTGKGAGFRLNAGSFSSLEFGPLDPASGSLSSVAASITGTGDVSTAGGIVAAGTVSAGGNGVLFPAIAGGGHAFALQWTGTRLGFYVDGVHVGYVTLGP